MKTLHTPRHTITRLVCGKVQVFLRSNDLPDASSAEGQGISRELVVRAEEGVIRCWKETHWGDKIWGDKDNHRTEGGGMEGMSKELFCETGQASPSGVNLRLRTTVSARKSSYFSS